METASEHTSKQSVSGRVVQGGRHGVASVVRALAGGLRHLRVSVGSLVGAATSLRRRDLSRDERMAHFKWGSRRAITSGVKAVAVVPLDAALGLAEGAAIAVGHPVDTSATRHNVLGFASAVWDCLPSLPAVARGLVRRPVFSASAGAGKVLMLTISRIEIDPRINKEADSLAAAGFDVEIVCFADEGATEIVVQQIRPGVAWVRVPNRGSSSILFQGALYRAAVSRQFDFVHAHDLTALLGAWCVARRAGVPLVYDAHEMWTENVEFDGSEWVGMSPGTRRAASLLEQFALRSTSIFITVSPSIEAEYRRRYATVYPRGPILVPNYPSKDLDQADVGPATIHELVGVPPTTFVTLYLGGVNPLRNIEAVIEAHAQLPDDCVFVIQGPGIEVYRDGYMAMAERLGIAHRVICRDPVGRHEVVAMARTADCGVVMLRNLCRNFYWFFPNKLFEYCMAGVPVAVSNFPDVTAFVEAHDCGVTFDPDSPASIAEALRTLVVDRDEARAKGARGREAVLSQHNWENAMKVLIAEYEALRT